MSARGGFVVEVVAHDGGGVVEELGDLGIGPALEALGQEVGVVAAAGLDEELADRGALLVPGATEGSSASVFPLPSSH